MQLPYLKEKTTVSDLEKLIEGMTPEAYENLTGEKKPADKPADEPKAPTPSVPPSSEATLDDVVGGYESAELHE